jgi:hypothetical protein
LWKCDWPEPQYWTRTRLCVALIPAPLLDAIVGDVGVRAEQTARLASLAARPSVELLVCDSQHLVAVPGSFTLLATAGNMADMGCVFTLSGPAYAEGAAAVADYVAAFEYLRQLARPLEASTDAIARAAARLDALMKGLR